jgi:hypothetical protein
MNPYLFCYKNDHGRCKRAVCIEHDLMHNHFKRSTAMQTVANLKWTVLQCSMHFILSASLEKGVCVRGTLLPPSQLLVLPELELTTTEREGQNFI